jgi:hypothetical protein
MPIGVSRNGQARSLADLRRRVPPEQHAAFNEAALRIFQSTPHAWLYHPVVPVPLAGAIVLTLIVLATGTAPALSTFLASFVVLNVVVLVAQGRLLRDATIEPPTSHLTTVSARCRLLAESATRTELLTGDAGTEGVDAEHQDMLM